MFFLRCAFWLSIVYASMSWPNMSFSARDLGTQALESGRTVATTVVAKTVAGATEHCAHHAQACLTDAAQLTSLFAASDGPSEAPEPALTPSSDASQAVPLPVPDPRRHARAAKLARAP